MCQENYSYLKKIVLNCDDYVYYGEKCSWFSKINFKYGKLIGSTSTCEISKNYVLKKSLREMCVGVGKLCINKNIVRVMRRAFQRKNWREVFCFYFLF